MAYRPGDWRAIFVDRLKFFIDRCAALRGREKGFCRPEQQPGGVF